MQVLIVGRGVPTKKDPMNGLFEYEQALALSKITDIEVHYLAIDLRSIRRWRKWGYIKYQKEDLIIHEVNIPVGRSPLKIRTKIASLAFKRTYQEITKNHKDFDIIHAHFIVPGYSVVSNKKNISRGALFYTEHSSILMNKETKCKDDIVETNSFVFSQCKGIAVSPCLVSIIKKDYDESFTYVPNMIDISLFQREIKKNREFTFIFVGGINKHKGVELAVDGFIRAKLPNAKLVVVGDGPDLNKIAKKHESRDDIEFTGPLPKEKVIKKMQSSHVFLLPSASETFGLAYAEALAAGLPVLATQTGGADHFLKSHNSILIKERTVDAVALSVLEMYKKYPQFDLKFISDEVQGKFSQKIVSKKLYDLYEEESALSK